jgi:hypothetical protein
MELIDRYVYAVTHRLPERQRKEIDRELRGLIEDMLEERAGEGEPTGAAVDAVLRELGDPRELAEKYRGRPRYLIAPEMTDAYFAVLKVVAGSIGLVLGIVFVIESLLDPWNVIDHFVEGIVSFVTSAMPQGFAWVTAAFMIISLAGVDGKNWGAYTGKGPWTPQQLPEVPDAKRRIPISEPISSVVFIVFFTALFVYFSDLFGIYLHADGGGRTVVPFFSGEGIRQYAWGFLAFAAATILLNAWKLRVRRWTPPLAWTHLAIQTLAAVFIVFVFMDNSIYNPTFAERLLQLGFLKENGDGLRFWTEGAKLWIAPAVALVLIVDVVQTLYKTYRK